jgi:alpha-D-xyloside xylohydrolase
VKTSAKLDELPLFVRAGSIVPIGPTEQWANEKPDAPIEIRVYPGADAAFSLYEDEGTNYNYEKGAYSIIPMKWNDRDHKLTIGKREGSYSGMPNQRQFSMIVVKPADSGDPGPEDSMVYDGEALTVHLK